MVLLCEEGSSCRGKKLPQIRDLPHDVNRTKSSLEEESPEPSGQDLRFNSPPACDRNVPNLLLHVGVGCSEQPLDLGSQISAHLSRTHTGQRAQSQRLYVLVTVKEVTGTYADKMKDNSMLEHLESESNIQQQNLLGFIVTANKTEYFDLIVVVLTS